VRFQFRSNSSLRRTCTRAVQALTQALAVLSVAALVPAYAAVTLRPYLSGFSSPVDINNAGDGRLFVVERGGLVKVIPADGSTPTTFLNVNANGTKIVSGGEQGLLGLAFHPNYATNGYFFVYYTRVGDGAIVIERYSRNASNPNLADAGSGLVFLVIPHPGRSNHNGGGLRFGADGYLYIAAGDGGGGGDPDCNGQRPESLLGKISRINVDTRDTIANTEYSIPADNPVWTASNARREIFALGLRNPWRITFDRVNGDLYIGDVGQGAREEVNLIPRFNPSGTVAPFNMGWPQREGTIAYSPTTSCGDSGLARTGPIVDYDHNSSDCSITGGYRYRGTRVPELASGAQYVYADYCTGRFWAATQGTGSSWTPRLLIDTPYNVSTFGEDNRGELYLADLGGTIYRIRSTEDPSLDIDGNASSGATTDGVLLLRYLFGARGDALIAGAIGNNPLRSSPQAIESFLANSLASFDIDGRPGTTATGDGLIILRYLLNLPDSALTTNTGTTRSATDIRIDLNLLR
jgi:glucose/arabinose dehydrogenase